MKADMPRLANVLILDSDNRGRETLVYGFEGEGVKAAAAAVTAEVPGLILSTHPQVLILTLRENNPDLVEFVKLLAESADTGAIPRLVLAHAEGFPPELRGTSSFIALPAFVRDVITAAKLLVGGSARPGEDGQSELAGALSEYGLYFILRTMVGLGRSGFVQVERGSRKGELRFSEGDLVSAQVGSLQGHAALHQLLLWEEAALEIKFRPVVRLGQSLPSGEGLLEDCERFLRDFAHATKNIGHAQSLFVQDAERVARLLDSIPAEVVPVMRLFDGQRSLGDVLEDSPFRVFDTLRTITRLLDMGIIRRKAIERPTTGFQHLRRTRGEEWSDRDRRPARPPIRPTLRLPPPTPTRSRRRASSGSVFLPAGGLPAGAPASIQPPGASSAPARRPRTRRSIHRWRWSRRPRARSSAATMAVHGELRVPSRSHVRTAAVPDVPKVVIDFGAVEEPAPPDPSPRTASGRTVSGVRSAEFDVPPRQPAEAPAVPPVEGPSIMVDPHLQEEMDAIEQQPPLRLLPRRLLQRQRARPRPDRPLDRRPWSRLFDPTTPAAPPLSSIVPISAIPTIPVAPVTAPAGPTAPPRPAPDDPLKPRRASSEFDAVESDFFAREDDIYTTESTEQAADADQGSEADHDGEAAPGGKNGDCRPR